MRLLEELTEFLKDLKDYKEMLTNPDSKLFDDKKKYPFIVEAHALKKSKEEVIEELREKLLLEHGVLKDGIAKLIGRTDINQFNKTWTRALSPVFGTGENKDALSLCIDYTLEAIGRLDKEDVLTKESKEIIESPKAFIVHGGETKARIKLQKFLTALGVQPLIIEEEPKEGRSVNQQVEHYMKQADCAIILGTADDKELKDGKLYPRRNVYIEIGRFQEKFPNRIIYLLEQGGTFPSDISEKLYTHFTQENMDEAFITIARELKKFGILKAMKPEKQGAPS